MEMGRGLGISQRTRELALGGAGSSLLPLRTSLQSGTAAVQSRMRKGDYLREN